MLLGGYGVAAGSNKGLEMTASSLRYAPAFGSGSGLAFGGPRGGGRWDVGPTSVGGGGDARSVAPRPGVGGGRAPWDRDPVPKAPRPTPHRTTPWSRPRQWELLLMRQSVHGAAAHRERSALSREKNSIVQ
jgi:hypothetical protein